MEFSTNLKALLFPAEQPEYYNRGAYTKNVLRAEFLVLQYSDRRKKRTLYGSEA